MDGTSRTEGKALKMTVLADATHSITLPTGTLSLTVEAGTDIDRMCGFASRANPKRGFLIVSKLLGRHIPARPSNVRLAMNMLADKLPADLPEPVVFLGMAETATALGQGVFAHFRKTHPGKTCIYLQTARQHVAGAIVFTSFEEGHSHATSHLVQIADNALEDLARSARTLVIVDDESSTGNTFLEAASALARAMPHLQRIETCCLTDWSGGHYLSKLPVAARANSLLAGSMEWARTETGFPHKLASKSNEAGRAPANGMTSRTGLREPEVSMRPAIEVTTGERVLVLGDGEHSYEALLIAEEIEERGGIAAVQCITRTPAMLGHAMTSVSNFDDAYGSGAPCFLYNILQHRPDRIIIASEIVGAQVEQAHAAVTELGQDIPVEIIECRYVTEGSAR
jgi:hypothetical protein